MIKILGQEHYTWQGTITWLGANETQPFRSALELIKLIDGVLEGTPAASPPPSDPAQPPET